MFDKTEQGTPRTWRQLLDQAVWWRTADGGWIRVADMDPRHRSNTVRWLLRRAQVVAEGISFEELNLMHGAPDDVVDGWLSEDGRRLDDPQAWLLGTPLVRALSESMRVDGDLNEALAAQARRDSDLAALNAELARGRAEESVAEVPAATPGGRLRDERGRYLRVPRDLGERALWEVLFALDRWISGAEEFRGAEVTWYSDDIRRMVADAAREIGSRGLAEEIEARVERGWQS